MIQRNRSRTPGTTPVWEAAPAQTGLIVDERDRQLIEPHMAPLMELVYALRDRGFNTPNVDPNDGGVAARALFLLETPGPRAVGTGYVSQDNPDPSAMNMRRALQQAGFDRSDVVIWNVVPYCLSSATRNCNATPTQIIAAVPETQAFLDRLTRLRAVIFCGQKARFAEPRLRLPEGAVAFRTAHTGAQAYNLPRHREDINRTFKAAYEWVSRRDQRVRHRSADARADARADGRCRSVTG